ncbi:MAG TPA: DNA translocase FtsK [Acidobacteriaceae bacterium]|jgi:S-DNA-T family DNA segregation ATPase FtsK/SpoIIIE|nr:DNA translocase FtsK [Acidobacteriaceae bacterium]
MKPLRLVSTPTRNRRLNEILGLVVVVGAVLLFLSLATYTPSDPSADTVGGVPPATQIHAQLGASNWTGVVGAYIADALLQMIGIAAFFLPVVFARVGVCWIRQRPAGSATARLLGLGLWLLFAPAMLGLLPGTLYWRHALPIEGVTGRLIADVMVQYLNLPGATIVLTLLVAVSLYLATTFTFQTAREWLESHFSLVRRMHERWQERKIRRANAREEKRAAMDGGAAAVPAAAEPGVFVSRREASLQDAHVTLQAGQVPAPSNTLLNGLLGWFGWLRRKRAPHAAQEPTPEQAMEVPQSVWDAMPRTNVDAPPVTSIGTAAAAAAPFAEALAAAAETGKLELPNMPPARMPKAEPVVPPPTPAPVTSARAVSAAMPLPAEPKRAPDGISFGKRADADIKPVTITPKSIRGYKLPASSLLYRSEEAHIVREQALRDEARVLVEKCAEFGVDGTVTQINPGPVVTTFEFRPDAGVKYSRVTGLADDLCLAMAAESILIERIAGKSTVGIQVPNHERETIWLRDVVECESFAQSKSRLAVAMGKDINGRIVTADLAAMPHVLIAGSTGSGKSVAINAMIMSILFKSTPEQVRMILVDPKRVELGMYEGIPHLFTPIITEAKLAANALRNAVREMERRLKLLAANHVRNIDQFNKLFDNGSQYLFDDPDQEPLPYIVIIIDELADLMMLDRANVEESITRLAQMARAVGIHLVLATQRPSVDVITGLIKANVPTRMSFRLATKVDSRTIIDSNGAESLLGKGDMLYLPPGTSRVQRVHAPFVTEKEIAAVTEFWKQQGEAEYVHGFLEGPKDEAGKEIGPSDGDDGNDELFDDAVRLVFEFGKASTSLLQRRLRIGYGRAAHLIDMMERDGLVGPADGSKPREILKAPDYYKEVDSALR